MVGARTRSVGLSHRTQVEPLLKSAPWNRRQDVAIDADPLSSSEDEEGYRVALNKGAGQRGDITRTIFGPTAAKQGDIQLKSKSRGMGISTPIEGEERESRPIISRRQPARSTRSKRKAADDDSEITNTLQLMKKSKSTHEKPLSQHDEDDPFERNDLNRAPKMKYGSKSSKAQGRNPKTITRALDPDDSDEDAPKPVFRPPPPEALVDDSSPEKPKLNPKELQARDNSDALSPKPVFRMPRADVDINSPDPKPPKFKIPETEKPKPKRSSWQDRRKRRRDKQLGRVPNPEAPELDAPELDAPEPEAEEMSQKPVFKIPLGFDDSQTDFTGPYLGGDIQLAGDGCDLSSIPDIDIPSGESWTAKANAPVCPMCKGDVDRNALDAFRKRPGMSFDQQLKFCMSHRKKTAEKTWSEKDYPDIDWGCLEVRITKHHPFLKSILEGASCHFRDKLDEKVANGEDRTVAKSRGRITPGYYGLRGQRVMSESIITKFSRLLRARAVEDGSISARGYTSFVQAVMVPELAVKLIMEDMGVKQGNAREILYESMDVGELLNEDVVDVVAKDVEGESQSESELSDLTEVMDLVDDSE